MSRKYKFHNPVGVYFVSFATVNWLDVFTREVYLDILAKSVEYCRLNKGMELYAYCFMSSHVHFVFRSANGTPSSLLRDFKKYTSKKIIHAINEHPKESRREWLLKQLKDAAEDSDNVSNYQFWQHHNQPVELWSTPVILQKINYIHNNPVVAGFVTRPEDWKYSSARNFMDDHSVLKIDDRGLMGE